MDPFTIGILCAVGASGAAAAMRWGRGRRAGAAARRTPPKLESGAAQSGDEVHVGDVLTYLGDEFWLAGELALVREGSSAIRLFTAPERGKERWVALPRDGRSLWVLFVDTDLAAIGWPGVEIPTGGRVLRRAEFGNAAIVPGGEGLGTWEGMGRFALFRSHDAVAVVIEGPSKDRLALVGREIPRQLVQKMG